MFIDPQVGMGPYVRSHSLSHIIEGTIPLVLLWFDARLCQALPHVHTLTSLNSLV